jgi:apolipoprotein D and lipocalin family protein
MNTIQFLQRSTLIAASLAMGLLLSACKTTPEAPMATVSAVDLARYQGKWYEVAVIPNSFQSMCVADTQAQYTADGDVIRVVNRCRKIDGSLEQASGVAKIVEGTNNSKLRVSFFRPFYGNYWILDLDADYQWVLVGEPGRKYGWILSRTPTLPPEVLNRILDKAVSLGYERSAFRNSPQPSPLN